MSPKAIDECSEHGLFRTELVNLINPRHELARLAELITGRCSSSNGVRISPRAREARHCPLG